MAAAAMLALLFGTAQAQSASPAAPVPADAVTAQTLVSRYPGGSIQSTETANQALAEIEKQRTVLDRQYADEQHTCYEKFFATSCLDAAKERHRAALGQLRGIEVEANAFIRSARVVERDRNLAEKRAKEASNPPNPAPDSVPGEAAGNDAQAAGAPHASHGIKLHQVRPQEKFDAQQRAENLAAYEKKVQDAEVRQREVAEKKAEKQKQAAAKAANAASTAGATPAKP